MLYYLPQWRRTVSASFTKFLPSKKKRWTLIGFALQILLRSHSNGTEVAERKRLIGWLNNESILVL
jgi:hypothetical protein